MGQLGIGMMIGILGGNEDSFKTMQAALGKTIVKVQVAPGGDGRLRFEFNDGSKLTLSDGGRLCCEERYMHTDDDLDYYSGATLTGFNSRATEETVEDYEAHEVGFVLVNTNKGTFTVETHNRHNGNYGGFWMIFSC